MFSPHSQLHGSKKMETTFDIAELVISMYQFPVSNEDVVGKEITYEPSKCAVTAVLYVVPEGLRKVALTVV